MTLMCVFLLSLKEFLPKEYIKNKGEKKIFQVCKLDSFSAKPHGLAYGSDLYPKQK